MRKIRLNLEDLAVESFRTSDGSETQIGTVRGFDVTLRAGCVISEASNCASCLQGCPNDTLTCQASCLWTDGNVVCKEPNC